MKRLGYVPALDGLRGVAILLVISNHFLHYPGGAGSTGVSLFFVLSGYLITTLLLEEQIRNGRISLRGFYARRARRLFPALAVLLAAYLVGAVIQDRAHTALRAVAAGGFYTANIVLAYWPDLIGRQPVGPLWSLAEEEQFYLVWPALLILLLALGISRKRVMIGLGLAIFAICVEHFWLLFSHANAQRMYASPETAADALLAGVLLALLLREREVRVTGETALVALLFLTLVSTGFILALGRPVVDVAGPVLVALALQPGPVSRVLAWRPLVWVGLISYSLYLWHMVVLSWFAYTDRGPALVLAFLIAWISYRFVEQPFRRRSQEPATDSDLGGLPFKQRRAAASPAVHEI